MFKSVLRVKNALELLKFTLLFDHSCAENPFKEKYKKTTPTLSFQCTCKIFLALVLFPVFLLCVCDVGNVGDVCLFRRVPLPFVCLV